MTFVPLSRPPVDDDIKRAVLAAIDSRRYILGPQCRQLESELRTERLVEEILTLPMTADHADEEIDRVVAAVRAFFGA